LLCRCEDLAEIIWLNRQQIRQLEMIQEGLNIPRFVSRTSTFFSLVASEQLFEWLVVYG
jgi:hypothetical protein